MKVETATIIIFLLLLVFILGYALVKRILAYYRVNSSAEGFTSKAITMDNPDEFYDDYYISRIDESYYPQNKNICRCSELYKGVFHGNIPKEQSKILLVGCNTGRFLDALCGISKNVSGVTKLKALQKISQTNAPSANVIHGNVIEEPELFPKNTFTHIIFEDREYYTIPADDRKLVLEHCKNWLRPEGLLIIRTVDPDQFDPMIPTAVPLSGINVQKYFKERKLDSQVRFTDGSKIVTHYTPIPSEHKAVFREDLYNASGDKLRTHIHRWFVPPKDVVIEEVMRLGYSHNDTIDLKGCTFPYESYEIFKNGVPSLSK